MLNLFPTSFLFREHLSIRSLILCHNHDIFAINKMDPFLLLYG